jgi:hypothetical protein
MLTLPSGKTLYPDFALLNKTTKKDALLGASWIGRSGHLSTEEYSKNTAVRSEWNPFRGDPHHKF